MENVMLNCEDVMKYLRCSKSKAYQIIRKLNEELREDNYLIISGRVPKKYFFDKFNLN